jgi:hypothetical protein
MKAFAVLLSALALMLVASCNHEQPTNVAPFDANDQVRVEVIPDPKSPAFSNRKLYKISLPVNDWVPTKDKPVDAFVHAFVGGEKKSKLYEDFDFFEVYKKYYTVGFAYDNDVETDVFLVYGRHRDERAIIPRSEPFAVPYYVTDDTLQNEVIIGVHLGRGQVTRIDKSTIQHLDGQIVNTNYVVGSDVNFWINNPRYNSVIGVEEIEWTFPDGAIANGWNVRHTPKARGTTQVKIIDKLGKVQKLYKNN